MNPIIHHSYKAMENGRTVEELLRSLGYSKSLINRIKLTDNGLLIHGELARRHGRGRAERQRKGQ